MPTFTHHRKKSTHFAEWHYPTTSRASVNALIDYKSMNGHKSVLRTKSVCAITRNQSSLEVDTTKSGLIFIPKLGESEDKMGNLKRKERNPRQIKYDYDFEPIRNFDYDYEKESWYKSAIYAYADSKKGEYYA